MLKIKLHPPLAYKRKYTVYLDLYFRRSFNNKRSAEDYTHYIEQELNQALLFINEELVSLTSFYRTYFIADRDYKFKYELQNSLDFISNRLTFVSVHSGGENYNSVILQTVHNCISELLDAYQFIYKKALSRYDCITRNRILLRKRIIDNYKESFDELKEEAVSENFKLKVC